MSGQPTHNHKWLTLVAMTGALSMILIPAASAGAGLATEPAHILAARAIQGIGGAMLGVIVVDGRMLDPLLLLTLLAVIVVAKSLGLYDRDQHLIKKTTLEEVPTLFHLTILTVFAIWLVNGGALSAAGALVLWATMFVGIVTARTLARMAGRRIAPAERCVVIGGEAIADELVAKLEADPGITVEFVQPDDVHEHLDDPRKLAAGGGFLLENQIHRVVLAGRWATATVRTCCQ